MSDDTPEHMDRIEIVYLGRCVTSERGEGCMIATPAQVDNHQETSRYYAAVFGAKNAKGKLSLVGGLYSAEAKLNEKGQITTIRLGTVEFIGPYAGKDAAAAFQAQDEADRLRLRATSREKTLAKDTALAGAVDRLRHIYQRMGHAQRLPFKLWLMEELDRR